MLDSEIILDLVALHLLWPIMPHRTIDFDQDVATASVVEFCFEPELSLDRHLKRALDRIEQSGLNF